MVGMMPENSMPGDIICQFWNVEAAAVLRPHGNGSYRYIGRAAIVGNTEEWDKPTNLNSFNSMLVALYSQLAMSSNRGTTEGLKAACNYFCLSGVGHVATWNFIFPTRIKKILWRVASLLCASPWLWFLIMGIFDSVAEIVVEKNSSMLPFIQRKAFVVSTILYILQGYFWWSRSFVLFASSPLMLIQVLGQRIFLILHKQLKLVYYITFALESSLNMLEG
jgi:hypothetical protein